jgi:hypothetical protein
LLIENNRAELADLLVDVVDIVLHCVDHNHLKTKSMSELFAPICLFPQISHCMATRRIAVGTKAGKFYVAQLVHTKQFQPTSTCEEFLCSPKVLNKLFLYIISAK